MRAATFRGIAFVATVILLQVTVCDAGMPALLPTGWTADSPRSGSVGSSSAADARWQAISFFVACLLLSAWGVKALWNFVCRDFPALPPLRYGRAFSLVVLWGLCFIVVLTMISGARELMTPGAWKKQGWTYTLADPMPADAPDLRRQALERLRFALWQYAALHEGRYILTSRSFHAVHVSRSRESCRAGTHHHLRPAFRRPGLGHQRSRTKRVLGNSRSEHLGPWRNHSSLLCVLYLLPSTYSAIGIDLRALAGVRHVQAQAEGGLIDVDRGIGCELRLLLIEQLLRDSKAVKAAGGVSVEIRG
jgi:hypothetical protein